MKIEFDPKKSEKNTRDRHLSFDEAHDFDWETATVIADDRKNYPEKRFVAVGYLNERLHVICFTPIAAGVRIISFRKANKREVKKYEETINE